MYDTTRWCAGPCNTTARRKVRQYEEAKTAYPAALAAWHTPLHYPARPEAPRIQPVYGEPIYDPACIYKIKAKMSKLDGAACVYAQQADGHRAPKRDGRVSGSSTRASLSPTVEDLDEFDGWLRDWRATYLRIDTQARQGGLADSISIGCAWLVARTERILTRPDLAKLFGDEVTSWHARLVTHDPSDIVIHRKDLRCDWCRGQTLEWRHGDDSVRCRRPDCGRVLRLDEYNEQVDDQVKAS